MQTFEIKISVERVERACKAIEINEGWRKALNEGLIMKRPTSRL